MTDSTAVTGDELDFDAITASPSSSFFEPQQPDPKFVREPVDEPDTDFVTAKQRSRKAKAYENKVSGVLKTGFQLAINNPSTVPDAAAIAMHAPTISRTWGDLADDDPRIARAIDWITEGTENPYASAIVATVPLVLQMVRNHEPMLEPKQRGIKIPFGKRKGERITLKFGIRLRGLNNLTNDPKNLADHVFTNPGIVAALEKNGWIVANGSSDADE